MIQSGAGSELLRGRIATPLHITSSATNTWPFLSNTIQIGAGKLNEANMLPIDVPDTDAIMMVKIGGRRRRPWTRMWWISAQ
jgi:hypothetical protein